MLGADAARLIGDEADPLAGKRQKPDAASASAPVVTGGGGVRLGSRMAPPWPGCRVKREASPGRPDWSTLSWGPRPVSVGVWVERLR